MRPAAPGWAAVAVAPIPGDLRWASGAVPLPDAGSIEVDWSLADETRRMALRVGALAAVEVRAKLPDGYEGKIEAVRR